MSPNFLFGIEILALKKTLPFSKTSRLSEPTLVVLLTAALFFCSTGWAQDSEKKTMVKGSIDDTTNASSIDAKKTASNTNQVREVDTTQIGNSYFKKKPADAHTQIINQLGGAYESHRRFSEGYAFFNQYFPNQVFYELRLLGTSHHLRPTPLKPPLVPSIIPHAKEHHVIGYGGIGILGYNFIGSPVMSFMPFVRLHAIANTSFAYDDIYGNRIRSGNYGTYIGGKLSIQLSNPLAFYAQYYGGYQFAALSGSGVYHTEQHAVVKSYPSFFEFGTPLKIHNAWNITPYMQLIYSPNRPNRIAQNRPYSIPVKTVPESLYAIKLGYSF